MFGHHTEPKMDLYEDQDTNTVNAIIELPGLAKENVHIDWTGDQIEVWAVIFDWDKSGYTICERHVGMVRRRLTTPRGIKEEDIKASLKNGLLTLSFPITPEPMLKRIMIS
ncbi:HSP20-like chaperone [Armillaria borealis]|uniref:HSP20-like chaperone n=1 Tax=Armillaria borealis TaxID=47425 RepID=A0AA39MEV0_9AGAR|nr:HSP20-like chaperone [Armillaria borealis]